MMNRRLCSLTWLAVMVGVVLAPHDARADVFSAGNDSILWVAWATYSADRNDPTVRFGYTDKPSLDAFRVPFEPRVGSVRHVAVSGESLHVVYAENVHYRFTKTDAFVELNVPGSSLPLAITGRRDGDGILAIASAADTREYVQAQTAALPTTQPGDSMPADAPTDEWRIAERLLIDNPAARFWLLSYHRGGWHVLEPIPPGLSLSVECWLAAPGDDLQLAWRERDGERRVFHAVRSSEGWSPAVPIAGAEATTRGTLLLAGSTPVFIAATPASAGGALTLEPFTFDGGKWSRRGALEINDRPLSVRTDKFSVASFGDRLAVVEQTDRSEAPIRIGFWPIEGGPTTTPFAVPARTTTPPASWFDDPRWDTLSYVVLFGVMILIFIRRQDSLLIPARLEPGFALASHGRRVVAFVLDFLPAVVVTIPLWISPLQAILEVYPSLQRDATPSPEELAAAQGLWFPWLVVRLVHTVYATIFELSAGATPGKMATSLSVRRLDGDRAGVGPILTRNISRLIELEPLLTLWPMMLLIVMTRNRQRVGDLLARTVVREHYFTIDMADVPPADRETDERADDDPDDDRR